MSEDNPLEEIKYLKMRITTLEEQVANLNQLVIRQEAKLFEVLR